MLGGAVAATSKGLESTLTLLIIVGTARTVAVDGEGGGEGIEKAANYMRRSSGRAAGSFGQVATIGEWQERLEKNA